MSRWCWPLLLFATLAVACGQPAPQRTPAGPIDLVFVPNPLPGLDVYSTADGDRVAELPAGAFDAGITGGGDLGEAYLVGADGVRRVRAGRPFTLQRVADTSGAGPWQAALIPAPALTTFVGERTVLVTLSADGVLAGYQAGNRIWRRTVPGAVELRRVDSVAALRTGAAWSTVIAVDGRTEDLVAGCPAGPWGMAGTHILVPCPGVSAAGLSISRVPTERPWEMRTPGGGAVLAWPDGTFVRYGSGGETARGHGGGGGRPAISPDGSTLYWPSQFPGANALAASRDGNFLFAVGGGTLRTFTTMPRRRLGAWPAAGADISLVVGG